MSYFKWWKPDGEDHVRFKLKPDDCVFCKYCIATFWDYTNGPYITICGLNYSRHDCNNFEKKGVDNG